jgi:hypothetical protein
MPIPAHDPRTSLQVSLGVFVRKKGRVQLLDSLTGQVWSLNRVHVLQGGWGDAVEGISKLPRARIDNIRTGENIVPGDRVLIAFLRSNPNRPIVLGGVRPWGDNAFLSRDHTATDADENALRMLLVARDEQGVKGGQIKAEANGGAGGALGVAASESLRLEVADDLDTATATAIELDSSQATISAGGTTEPVILGRTFLTDLLAALTNLNITVVAIQGYLTGLGLVTPPMPDLTSTITKITTSLSVAGKPHLATYLKVE